ncbi:MAG TPA: hypothetical protein VFF69_12010, partial [Phycisphaerales bacterium]|nr:hypothetical protein [Phycisphaerales bacterium]
QEFLADSKRLDCLLGDYLDGQLKLHNLAAAHHVTVVELIAILDHPDVVAILDALIRHAALQAERIAILVRPEAVEKLAELARRDPEYNTILPPLIQARSRETIRKAAAQIERISNPKPLRSATRPRVTPVAAVPPVGGEGSAPPTGAASHHPSPSAPSAPGNSPAGAPSLAPENPDPPPRAPRPCAACALPLR